MVLMIRKILILSTSCTITQWLLIFPSFAAGVKCHKLDDDLNFNILDLPSADILHEYKLYEYVTSIQQGWSNWSGKLPDHFQKILFHTFLDRLT